MRALGPVDGTEYQSRLDRPYRQDAEVRACATGIGLRCRATCAECAAWGVRLHALQIRRRLRMIGAKAPIIFNRARARRLPAGALRCAAADAPSPPRSGGSRLASRA